MPDAARLRVVLRSLRSPSFTMGLLLVVLVLAVAVGAPLLTDHDPTDTATATFVAPEAEHPMGTDNLGRDTFAGVLYGMRVSLAVGLLAALIATVIGMVVGLVAGYVGGNTDQLLMRLTEMFQVIPQFFLALVLVALIGRGIDKVILVLGILGWPLIARVVRAQVLSLKEREFTEAARALGASDARISILVLLPNAIAPVIVTGTQTIGQAILLEAGISFFGLGDPNLMSLGYMVNEAQTYLIRAWWMSVFPGLGIFAAVLGFTLMGDGMNDVFNPRWQR